MYLFIYNRNILRWIVFLKTVHALSLLLFQMPLQDYSLYLSDENVLFSALNIKYVLKFICALIIHENIIVSLITEVEEV